MGSTQVRDGTASEQESDTQADPEVTVVAPETAAGGLSKYWPIGESDKDALIVAGTRIVIEGLDVAPELVTPQQLKDWHAACDQARARMIGDAAAALAYGYAIGRALFARQFVLKKERGWGKWLRTLSMSSATAYNYIDVYKYRDQRLAGEKSSNALELPPELTQRRLLKLVRQERRQVRTGEVPPEPTTNSRQPGPGTEMQWTYPEVEAARDALVKAVKESPRPTLLAHELVTVLLQKYGEPDWLGRQRVAERLGIDQPPEPRSTPVNSGPQVDLNDLSSKSSAPKQPASNKSLLWVDRYRPMKFADVTGQDEAIAFLAGAAMRSNPLRLLLIGPAGSGKTTLAWITARRWCCTERERQDPEPCEQCEACEATRLLEQGYDNQIKDVSAATYQHSGNATRALQAMMGYDRVLIVDEADQMKDAALALVRNLDRFKKMSVIFCACDVSLLEGKHNQFKSRLKTIKIAPLTAADVATRLLQIARAENMPLTAADATRIAVDDDGEVRSPREAIHELESRQ